MEEYEAIRAVLLKYPDEVIINQDGDLMYLLVGPEQRLMCVALKSGNFHEMSQQEINTIANKALLLEGF